MAKLQAKTELARNSIMSLFKHFVSVDEDGVSLLCYVTFDTMAEIVDYLRGDEFLIKVEEPDLLSKIEYAEIQRKVEDYSRLLDENIRLANACELLKNRICELIKKYKEE